jgi:hypothetical protein
MTEFQTAANPKHPGGPGVFSLALGRALIPCHLLLAFCAFTHSARAQIVGWTKTAQPGDTLFLAGQNLGSGMVQITDGRQTLAARILKQDGQKLLAVVPPGLGNGTLWASPSSAGVSGSAVPINYPEPWWAQPDRVGIGGTTRIFGRNFNGQGSTIEVILNNAGTMRYFNANVLNGDTLTLTLSNLDLNGNALASGTNLLYLKEPKSTNWYGPISLVVQSQFVFPAFSVNVTNFGAIPNDGTPHTQAFVAAFNAVAQNGGGMVVVPAGTFTLDDTLGYASVGAVLPSVNSTLNSYILQGAGVGQTILEFKPTSGATRSAFNGIALLNNSVVSNLTVQLDEGVYSTNFNNQNVFLVRGTNTLISDVVIKTDGTSNCMVPILIGNDYATVRNIQIYCSGWVSYNGRQIEITNVTHYGAREMEWYNLAGQDIQNVFGALFLTTGSSEVCLEGCTGFGRWEQTRGHFKRFFAGQLNAGAVKHTYLANNLVTNHVSQPWSNSGECILFEGADGFYSGPVSISGNVMTLQGGTISSYAASAFQNRVPLTVIIRDGTGFGQYRHGTLNAGGATITLDSPFTISPDGTSTVVVGYTFEENIVANNSLYSGTPYPGANVGIEVYGESLNNHIHNNYLVNYQNAYLDWVFSDAATVAYYNEVSSNVISGALRGMGTIISPGTASAGQHVGNVYRGNTITNMNLTLPLWYRDHRFEGLSIQAMAGAAGPTNTIIGPVYEDNYLDQIRAPFGADSNATWVTVRNNRFSDVHVRGYITNTATILESNILAMLPTMQLTASTAPYRSAFYSAIAAYGNFLQSSNDIYIWSTNGSGSLAFNVANGAADTESVLNAGSITGISLVGSNLCWTNLSPDIYPFSVTLTGSSGSNAQQLYLVCGPYDDFEGAATVSSNNLAGTALSCTLSNRFGQYVTQVTSSATSSGMPCSHALATAQIYNGSSTVLKLTAINEEVALRNAALDSNPPAQYAVLSFVKNMYNQLSSNSTVKVRLLCGTNQYYEFVDYPFYNPYFKLRTLSKVVNGTPVQTSQSIASHSTESMVVFEKIGSLIKLAGWGDTIELTDPNPMPVNEWEVLLATYPGSDAFNTTYNSWISLDNIHFETGAVPGDLHILGSPSNLHIVPNN